MSGVYVRVLCVRGGVRVGGCVACACDGVCMLRIAFVEEAIE